MLLVRAGLSEDESDRFLERLGDDLHAGKLEDQDARLKFIEAELAQTQDWQHAQPKPPSDVRIAVVAVITGLFTNALYDIVKGPAIRVADDLFAAQSEDEVAEVIQVEWADLPLPRRSLAVEPTLTTALQIREQRQGTVDRRTALYSGWHRDVHGGEGNASEGRETAYAGSKNLSTRERRSVREHSRLASSSAPSADIGSVNALTS
jgi:hypothetical protein